MFQINTKWFGVAVIHQLCIHLASTAWTDSRSVDIEERTWKKLKKQKKNVKEDWKQRARNAALHDFTYSEKKVQGVSVNTLREIQHVSISLDMAV